MPMHRWFYFATILLSAWSLKAQQVYNFAIPKSGEQHIRQLEGDYYPALQRIAMPNPSTVVTGGRQLPVRWSGQDTVVPLGGTDTVQLGTNFNGNLYNLRTPNDNHIAVGNNDTIVSVINSIIYYYNAATGKFIETTSLAGFASPLGYTESKYDPRVLYDPDANRFIMVFLNGSLDSTSRIIVGFSQSSDPLAGWHLYALNGNPIDNATWSDFPAIAVSASELFITVNTFTNGSVNNSGFEESTIWQINKADGYAGDTLQSRYFAGLTDNGEAFSNITPIPGGTGPYGDTMYFAATKNMADHGDTLYLFTMDNTIGNNGQLSYQSFVLNQQYFEPPRALMPTGDSLDCNDARVLSGFYENQQLHLVGNSTVPSSGRPGVYHCVVYNWPQQPVPHMVLLSDTVDMAYPSIAYAGHGPADHSAIIVYNFSSSTRYPASASIFYDGAGNYSRPSTIKAGISGVDILSGAVERWGDYSGIQRKYNESGTVWSATSYARSNAHFTWIASHSNPFLVRTPMPSAHLPAEVFPNPASSVVRVRFTLRETRYLRIALYDLAGREVALLLSQRTPPGTYQFACIVDQLARGTYILTGTQQGKTLFSEKVIKQ